MNGNVIINLDNIGDKKLTIRESAAFIRYLRMLPAEIIATPIDLITPIPILGDIVSFFSDDITRAITNMRKDLNDQKLDHAIRTYGLHDIDHETFKNLILNENPKIMHRINSRILQYIIGRFPLISLINIAVNPQLIYFLSLVINRKLKESRYFKH